MKGLLAIIQKIYGKSALSKTIGTRTNVIKLPNNEIKQYIKKDLNIEAASDKLAEKAKQEMLELVPDVPKMNDAERLIFEGNLRRLDNKLNPPMAEVTEFGTKQKVSPEGIQSLIQEKGQKAAPGTLMGNLESRLKQLEASGKGLEELTKGKGQTLEDIMTDALQSQGLSKQMYNEGLVRATARDIITADIKSGKLQLPKQLQQDLLEGGGEPIEVLRTVYGEDALEVLDSLIPEFSKLRTSTEAADLAKSKFKFEPDVNRPKGSMSPEEAIKAEQENILKPKKPEEPEEFAVGGRAGYSAGSIVKGILLTAKTLSELKPEYLKKLSRLEGYLGSINMEGKGGKEAAKQTIDKIDNLKKEYKALQKDLSEKEQLNKLDITDRVPNAQGGVSQGLDYLMGIERPKYQLGGSVYDRYKELLNEISNPGSATSTQAVPYYPTTSTGGGNDPEQFDPIQSSIQQQLTPVGPVGELINNYLQVPGILSTIVSMGKDYLGLTDAQKDVYSEYGLGYGNSGIKDAFGYNVFSLADNWATPGSASYNAHKASGKTDQQIKEMRDRVMSAPTKADMRQQQKDYNVAQAQRQQDYANLANQGTMGIGMNPGAYAAHSLAALGPAYDDPNEFSSDTSNTDTNTNTNTGNTGFGDDNDGYGNDGDSSGGSAGSGDTGSTCSCGSFKQGGPVTGASVRPNHAIGGRIGYANGTGLGLTSQQSSMISDMAKRGMDADTISAVTGVSTEEVQNAINNQAPAQANQIAGQQGFFSNINPLSTLGRLGLDIATGGLSRGLGTFAKTQALSYFADRVLSPIISSNIQSNMANNQIDWDAVDRDQAGDTGGDFGGFDSAAEDRDQSGGEASSTSGADPAGDGGDGYAIGGRVRKANGGLSYLMGI